MPQRVVLAGVNWPPGHLIRCWIHRAYRILAILTRLGDVNMRPNPVAGPIPPPIKPSSGQAPSSHNVRLGLHAAPNNATLCKPVTGHLTAAALFQAEEPAYLARAELECLQ